MTTANTGVTYETKEYRKHFDPEVEREHGPNADLESYYTYSEDNVASVFNCTTDEREDFERQTDVTLMADTLKPDLFNRLVDWAKDEALLVSDSQDTRDEFTRTIDTQEDGITVNVSYSDSLDVGSSCLIQTGTTGNFTCTYLTDKQAKQLSDALLAFIALPLD